MTTFSGNLGASLDYVTETNQTTNLQDDDGLQDFAAIDPQQEVLSGSFTDNTPIAELTQTFSGNLGWSGAGTDTFYYRFHIIPSEIDAGNVVSPLSYTVQVWNAWLDPKDLDAINETNTTGLTMTPPEAVPFTFPGLELMDFTLDVSEDGPALVEGVYSFEFSSGESLELTVTGQRVFAWTFKPNWAKGVEERLEWATDVMTAYDGTEQRMGLRQYPRRVFSYEFMIDNNRDRRKFEAQLFNWGARNWIFPIWTEGQSLGAVLPAETSTLTLTRKSPDWQEGGNAIIMTGAFEFEVVRIDTITGLTVTLNTATEHEWPAHAVLYPAFTALLEDKQELTRFTGSTELGRCTMRLIGNETVAADSPTTYRGLPVVEDFPDWSRDVTNDYLRKLQVLDFRIGAFEYEDQASMPFQIHSHNWTLDGKDEIDAFREFLYARAGKHKAVWLPTFTPDIELAVAYQSTDSYMDVEHGKIAQHLWGHVNRKDIMIELVDGTVFYRRITDVDVIDDDTERLTISSALGQNVAVDEIRRISWMSIARLDSDQVTLLWRHDDWVECSQNWRTVRDDI